MVGRCPGLAAAQDCPPTDPTEAKTRVRAHTNQPQIIKNSWGTGWGISGYMYVKMTGDSYGPCGMYLR